MFPADLYLPYYHHVMLLMVLSSVLVYIRGSAGKSASLTYNSGMLWVYGMGIVLFLGTRPISPAFVDMTNYAASYARAAQDASSYPDWGFDWFMRTCASSISVESFFFWCAVLYVVPLIAGMRKAHGDWAMAPFLALAGSFSFFAYGTNGIRNGISTSLLICAFAYRTHILPSALLMIVAYSMHRSVLLPIAAFLFTALFSRVIFYGLTWAFTFIAVSLNGEAITGLVGKYFEGSEDERLANYVANTGMGNDRGGYRLDFSLYSIVPVLISYLLAGDGARKDELYRRLICTYLAANTIWLLLMHASYSNRFAYLSWFIMPWVIICPFIPALSSARRESLTAEYSQQEPKYGLLSAALAAHYAFTYAMEIFILPARGQ